jgi:hypothetical protein
MAINKQTTVFFCLLIAISIILPTASQGQSKVGTTAVPFLGISVGPRATAMGGAFTAMCSDATALYYNPGGIAQIDHSQFLATHTGWLVGTSLNWIGFVYKLDPSNAIGIHVTHLDYGEEEVTTVDQPEGTGEKWTALDFAAGLSYARNLTDRFSIGGSMKFIQQRLWNESASAFAMDVGLLFVTDFNGMKLGMSISNFGTDMQMDGKDLLKRIDLDPEALGNNETIVSKLKTENWPLPLFFRVGVAMDVMRFGTNRLTISVDALRPSDNTEIVNAGGEIALGEMFFLRGGYKSLFREQSEEGLTLGCGADISLGSSMIWSFDYTYADFGLFQDIQMVSIGFKF